MCIRDRFEAGRSLGLNYSQTMKLVIIPQAVKNILPALLNEFISLLKEMCIRDRIKGVKHHMDERELIADIIKENPDIRL